MRQPRIAGVGGGVGTTTIAHALWAVDDDLYNHGEPVDVLVCRTTTLSLGDVHAVIAKVPHPPVLAVVADIPASSRQPLLPRPVSARMRMVEPHLAGLVAVPFVAEWRSGDDPYSEAAHVLRATSALPKHLREFARSMTQLTDALNELLRPQPSQVRRPERAPASGSEAGYVPALFPQTQPA